MLRCQFVAETELCAVHPEQLLEGRLLDHCARRQTQARVQDVIPQQLEHMRHIGERVDLPETHIHSEVTNVEKNVSDVQAV